MSRNEPVFALHLGMEKNHSKFQSLIRHSLVLATLSVVACAKVNFANQTPACQGTGSTCTSALGTDNFDYTVTQATQPIDVLFVVDNSASMYAIQQSIGSKFPSLFTTLSKYDYHLAITTTDISDASLNPARSINQNGALQDGKLVSFGSTSYLSSAQSTSTAQALFQSKIARPETLSCEQYIASYCPAAGCTDQSAYNVHCPSQDTRGINAAYLTLRSDSSGFMRSNVPLAVVIVSNADERANGANLTSVDYPSTLMSQAQSQGKSLSAYSIIIKPGDSSCYNSQHYSASLFGWYGNNYSSLSASAPGNSSSICNSDFSSNLSSIGSGIASTMNNLSLYCAPLNQTVTVTDQNGTSQTLRTTSSTATSVALNPPLQPGQSLQVKYSCNSQ